MAHLVIFALGGVSFVVVSVLYLTPLRPVSLLLLSSVFLLHSLLSSLIPSPSDPLSPFLPLSVLLSSLPTLLYSLSLLLLLPSLSSLLPLLRLSSLLSPVLLLLLRRRDPDAIESRYFDLLSLPLLFLLLASLLSLARPRSPLPRLASAAALALTGTWLLQMAFSLFSPAGIAHGCFLHRRSYSNYTVQCKGHPEYHRARSIATLQFNCHLAMLVVVAVVGYSCWMGSSKRLGEGAAAAAAVYRPLSKEMRDDRHQELARFSLEEEIESADDLELMEMRKGYGESQ